MLKTAALRKHSSMEWWCMLFLFGVLSNRPLRLIRALQTFDGVTRSGGGDIERAAERKLNPRISMSRWFVSVSIERMANAPIILLLYRCKSYFVHGGNKNSVITDEKNKTPSIIAIRCNFCWFFEFSCLNLLKFFVTLRAQ